MSTAGKSLNEEYQSNNCKWKRRMNEEKRVFPKDHCSTLISVLSFLMCSFKWKTYPYIKIWITIFYSNKIYLISHSNVFGMVNLYIYEGVPKRNQNYFLKAIYFQFFYKTTLFPSKYSPLQLIHLSHRCFHCLKQFL